MTLNELEKIIMRLLRIDKMFLKALTKILDAINETIELTDKGTIG